MRLNQLNTIGTFEAKTHLSALLDRVANGERITITRHGVPAAVLMPVEAAEPRMSHQQILEGFRSLRKRVKPSKMTTKQMIETGRRI